MNEKPEISREEVALLEAILGTGEWMHAREIAEHSRWRQMFPQRAGQSEKTYREAAERRIRGIANGSGGSILSYPGSPGYRLRVAATSDEVRTAIAKLKHQGAEMMSRASAIENFGKENEQLQLV